MNEFEQKLWADVYLLSVERHGKNSFGIANQAVADFRTAEAELAAKAVERIKGD